MESGVTVSVRDCGFTSAMVPRTSTLVLSGAGLPPGDEEPESPPRMPCTELQATIDSSAVRYTSARDLDVFIGRLLELKLWTRGLDTGSPQSAGSRNAIRMAASEPACQLAFLLRMLGAARR